jgi:hypothetical protein
MVRNRPKAGLYVAPRTGIGSSPCVSEAGSSDIVAEDNGEEEMVVERDES